MAFLDIFVGVPQSKYAAYAIFASIAVVALAIMFGNEEIPIGQKFSLVLIIFLVSLPGIILTLFQLTCMVTGDSRGRTPWCGWYAWLISALMIVYCILLIAIAVIAMATGASVTKELQLEAMQDMNESKKKADDMAKGYFEQGAASADAASIAAEDIKTFTAPAPTPMLGAPPKVEGFEDAPSPEFPVAIGTPSTPTARFANQKPLVNGGRSLPAEFSTEPQPVETFVNGGNLFGGVLTGSPLF